VRSVPVRLYHDRRSRNLSILGLPAVPSLNRIIDRSGRIVAPPPEGLLLSKTLADILGVSPGERVRMEVLEGSRNSNEAQITKGLSKGDIVIVHPSDSVKDGGRVTLREQTK
jgi:putative ABC transport system permease protein